MFKVLGIETLVDPKTDRQQIATHWELFFQKLEQIEGTGMYVVYSDYQGNYLKPYCYLIGKKVPLSYKLSEADKKRGLTLREIPQVNYEIIPAKGKMPLALIDQWKKIWESKEGKRSYQVDYEEYKSESEVDIYLGMLK